MNANTGLTTEEVEERKRRGLSNEDGTIRTKTFAQIVNGQIWTLFNFVNFALALCVGLVQSYRNMLFLGVAINNLALGIYQEVRAKLIIDKLSLLSVSSAHVIRDGEMQEIPVEEIVLDDVVELKAGMQICSDSMVLNGECEVNESLLTGESDSIAKHHGDTLLSGSYVISGMVQAKVIHVGLDNYTNQITADAKYVKKANSEIRNSVMWIVKIVSIIIIPVSIMLFFNQIQIENQNFQRSVVSVVAALIGMIPEGLVLLTSVVMAMSAARLGKRNALVQELYSVEKLARADVFCLDKTGTITEGDMKLLDVESCSKMDYKLPLCEMISAIEEDNKTFRAIYEFYHKESEWEIEEQVSFSSERKWSLVCFKEYGTYVLGAPEYVLRDMDAIVSETVQRHIKLGERVLLFAHSEQKPNNKKLPTDIKPLALLYIEDIIRDNACETIRYLKEQDMQLKVISGDNPETVSHIARKIGIESAENYLDCSSLTSEAELKRKAETCTVFGRVSPKQKLILIKQLRERHTVAMTGDGVNDVLALKEADCGIAMQSGSEAAKNVSEIILMNSDFASIPFIIAEGRKVINNLTRSSSLFFVKTVFSCFLAVIFCFLNKAYPFQPIQLTLISTVCIGIPSFLLALEKNSDRVISGFLQKVLKGALPGALLIVTNVMICLLIQTWIPMNVGQIGTLATYSCVLVFAIILFHICYPFSLLRGIMYAGLIVCFIFVVWQFGHIFYIERLSWQLWMLLVAIESVNVTLYKIYREIIQRLLNKI